MIRHPIPSVLERARERLERRRLAGDPPPTPATVRGVIRQAVEEWWGELRHAAAVGLDVEPSAWDAARKMNPRGAEALRHRWLSVRAQR